MSFYALTESISSYHQVSLWLHIYSPIPNSISNMMMRFTICLDPYYIHIIAWLQYFHNFFFFETTFISPHIPKGIPTYAMNIYTKFIENMICEREKKITVYKNWFILFFTNCQLNVNELLQINTNKSRI